MSLENSSPIGTVSRCTPKRDKSSSGFALTTIALLVLTLALCVGSLSLGARTIPLADALTALVTLDPASTEYSVILERRVPRTIIAIVAGSALASAGALLQAMTRNPLADTGVLGINAGAAFLAAVALSVLGWTSPVAFVTMALIGAIATIALVCRIGLDSSGGIAPLRLVLAGIAVGAILEGISDGLALVDPQTFARLRAWMLGTVDLAGYQQIVISGIGLIIGSALVFPQLGSINLLSLGDESAAALGVNLKRTRALIIVAVTIMAATTTAAVGVFAFVGLATAHIVRSLGFHDDRSIICLSAAAGPALLLLADIVGRLIIDSELPASVVVAFIAGPILIASAQKDLYQR